MRAVDLLPQLARPVTFDVERASSGLTLILWGLFKKIVIADRLALYVVPVYSDPSTYSGFHYLIATYMFAFQVYCDFSGYSDIALGTARLLGYELVVNFRQPYFATSVRDFWGRWHVSLSNFLRDYRAKILP
jgi:D-alanyl-lipoteichoic acid acyltransferase DltB (MBOAT superfamily)